MQTFGVVNYDNDYNYDDNDDNDHCDELQAGARPLREVGPSGDPNKPSKRTHTHTYTRSHTRTRTRTRTHTQARTRAELVVKTMRSMCLEHTERVVFTFRQATYC